MGMGVNAMPKSASTSTLSAIGSSAQSKWELLLMHGYGFPREAKQHTLQQWYEAVDGVMQQLQEAKEVESRIQHRAPHNRHASSIQQSSSLVGVSA